MSLYCPKCSRTALDPITYRGVTIDKCPSCNGVWLDDGEEGFVQEILRSAGAEECKDCAYFETDKKECRLLKIFVTSNFHCSNYIPK